MVSDTGYLVARLKCFLKSIVSRGILQCFRLILALTRRLLGFHDPKHTNPGYTATYGSSCAIQQQPTLSVPYVPPVDSVHCTSATNLSGLAPGSALSVAQYPPSTAPLTPQTSQADLGRSASPAKALVQPFAPEEVQRYKRNIRINKKVIIPPIRPLQVDYNRPRIHDWQRCTHPEGAVYFRWDHDGKRTITDSNMDDQHLRELTTDYTTRLWAKAEKRGFHGQRKVLVLATSLEAVGTCRYYFVSHDDKVIFWLQEFIPDCIFDGVKGVQAIDHIKYAVESQYWAHCELYPSDGCVEEKVVDELRSTLIFASSEAILSDSSLVPFSAAELQQLLDLVTNIGDWQPLRQASPSDWQVLNGRDACIMCVVARLMRIFTRLKFVNFHGQAGARLNADQSLYERNNQEDRASPSPYFSVLDLFLFGAASNHIRQLHRIWVDRTINVLRWRSFISILSNEWNGFTIYSTVMLAVDVSLLAIPELNGSTVTQTVAQVAICLSTLSAVGSLVASVLLTCSSRGKGSESAEEAAAYMQKMADNTLGLNTLAVMFSVPFALVIWGMIFFVVAFSTVVFGLGDLAPRMVVIPFWVLVAFMASWPAWYKGDKVFFWLRKKGRVTSKKERRRERADPV